MSFDQIHHFFQKDFQLSSSNDQVGCTDLMIPSFPSNTVPLFYDYFYYIFFKFIAELSSFPLLIKNLIKILKSLLKKSPLSSYHIKEPFYKRMFFISPHYLCSREAYWSNQIIFRYPAKIITCNLSYYFFSTFAVRVNRGIITEIILPVGWIQLNEFTRE